MKKLCLMFIGALLAYQTTAVAQTTPSAKAKTSKHKTKKTTTAAVVPKTPGQEYSTSDRSGLNSYNAATDSATLGVPADTSGQAKIKTSKKSSKKTTKTHVKSVQK
jgi:hypothetical protein